MTFTDRELLELAAKAAGYEWRKDIAEYRNERGLLGLWIIDPMKTSWNPLDDDGDALRLAVKLGIQSDSGIYTKKAWAGVLGNTLMYIEEYDNDPYAATRRAIVRAAAEIGRNM